MLAGDLRAEGTTKPVARGAGASDAGSRQAPLERGLLGFAVEVALVLLLDPGLGGSLEEFEGQLWLTLEHGHQPYLHRGSRAAAARTTSVLGADFVGPRGR
jgi:hypothetical protein